MINARSNLLGAQPLGTGVLEQPLGCQILPDQLGHRRMLIEEASNGLQFLGMIKSQPVLFEIELFLARLAHSGPLSETYLV
jgi:hypothetical protein